MFAAGGVGAVGAAFVVGQRGQPKRDITWMYVCWTVATLAVVGYGLARTVPQLMVACLALQRARGRRDDLLVDDQAASCADEPARSRLEPRLADLDQPPAAFVCDHRTRSPTSSVCAATLVGAGFDRRGGHAERAVHSGDARRRGHVRPTARCSGFHLTVSTAVRARSPRSTASTPRPRLTYSYRPIGVMSA